MTFNEIVGENIRHYRKINGLTIKEIASKVGITEATMQKYEVGKIRRVDVEMVKNIADAIGVEPSALTGWTAADYIYHNATKENKPTPRKIPVLGHVAAGIPLEMIEDIIDEEEIPGDMVGDYFALKIKGDSMEPKISNGDVVIVRKQPDVESGQIAIVTVNGDDATCKRVMKYSDGIMLLSNNPNYAPMQFSNKEIENKPIKILGKVVELRAKFE